MKNALKKALSVLLVAVMVFGTAPLSGLELPEFNLFVSKAEAVTTSGTCGENLTWTLDGSTGELTVSGTGKMEDYLFVIDKDENIITNAPWGKYASLIKSVTISDGITNIGDSAFYGCESIESVSIPDSVTSIGFNTFFRCINLKSITIPDSVTDLGGDAFYYCNSLESVYIPASVTNIFYNVFGGSSNLKSITVDPANPAYSNDEHGVLFNKDKTVLIEYPAGNPQKSYTVPDSVNTIEVTAFYDSDNLTNINISYGVTSIDDSAFWLCDNLVSIKVDPANPTFSSDKNDILFSKDKTTLVYYPIGKAETGYTIPYGVTSIGNRAFCGCSTLKSITIPDSVISIGLWAFSDITNLESIAIPNSVIKIDKCAFERCENLAYVTIGNGLKSIESSVFESCENLENVTIGNSVTSIGRYAFEDCTSLKNITIPENVTYIDAYAFYGCTSLEKVVLPQSVKHIYEAAFYNCENIENVYYGGSSSEWGKIVIDGGNDNLTSATIHYNSTGTEDSVIFDAALIPTPSQTTISYGDSIVLHVDYDRLPADCYLQWYESNHNFNSSVAQDGSLTITPAKTGVTTFTVYVYDANSTAVYKDEQTMTSKAGFFDKIIAFFKGLFGLTKTFPNAFKSIY